MRDVLHGGWRYVRDLRTRWTFNFGRNKVEGRRSFTLLPLSRIHDANCAWETDWIFQCWEGGLSGKRTYVIVMLSGTPALGGNKKKLKVSYLFLSFNVCRSKPKLIMKKKNTPLSPAAVFTGLAGRGGGRARPAHEQQVPPPHGRSYGRSSSTCACARPVARARPCCVVDAPRARVRVFLCKRARTAASVFVPAVRFAARKRRPPRA